jgi:hypothetical protein
MATRRKAPAGKTRRNTKATKASPSSHENQVEKVGLLRPKNQVEKVGLLRPKDQVKKVGLLRPKNQVKRVGLLGGVRVRTVGTAAGGLIRKLRKPLAPPTRVGDDGRKYRRAREQNRLRRETESDT